MRKSGSRSVSVAAQPKDSGEFVQAFNIDLLGLSVTGALVKHLVAGRQRLGLSLAEVRLSLLPQRKKDACRGSQNRDHRRGARFGRKMKDRRPSVFRTNATRLAAIISRRSWA